MKVNVDRDSCIGCGLCADICPDVFELDDEDIAVVKQDPVPSDLEDDVKDAADQCPVECIEVVE